MYKIRITKIEEVKNVERNREIVETEPLTENDYVDKYSYIQTEIKEAIKEGTLPTVDTYAYVETEVSKNIETEILSQTVEELDFPSVIKAINGL